VDFTQKDKLKIIIAGGGTGGHLFPGIALVEEILSRFEEKCKVDILFIGTKRGLESQVIPALGYQFRSIWIRGFQRGRTLRDILINIPFPFRVISSLIKSFFIVKFFKPDFAIGTGGYSSGPPLYIAAKLKIPIFLHEQNVFPGVTTRLLSKYTENIYSSYEDTKKYINKTKFIGTPLRKSLKVETREKALHFFNLETERKTIFMFGGSQGSRALNNFLYDNLDNLIKQNNCQFIWQTGRPDFHKIKIRFSANPYVHITPFIHEMGIAYSASDLVISRSGALTIAELCDFGIPSIQVPLPTAAGNHQEINARILEKAGAVVVILQRDLNQVQFQKVFSSIIEDDKILEKMASQAKKFANTDSAKLIIDDILKNID